MFKNQNVAKMAKFLYITLNKGQLEIVKDVTKEILRRNLILDKVVWGWGQHYLVLNKISTL